MGLSVRRFAASFVVVVAVASGITALPAGAATADPAQAQCDLGKALKDDGERELAHAAYLKAVAVNPDSECGNEGVKMTAAPSSTPIWTHAGTIATSAAVAVGAILLAVLLLVVAALLWLQVQTRTPWLRDRWPAHRIRRPVFSVSALTDTSTDQLGEAVAGLIRSRVTWRTDRFGLNLVSGQASVASAFSGLGDLSGEAKAAVAVITFLTAVLPRRRFELSGQLQPAGEEGVGISLELSKNGDAEALTALWAASYHLTDVPNPTAYQHLAVPCAAWVDIWMTKALGGGGLLTRDPQSWAFFRSGMDAQRLGDRKRARGLYEQALAADGTNVGAMANLGILCRREGQYRDAEDYLNRALPATEGDKMAADLAPAENPDWYRIKYQLAALYTNWATASEDGTNKDDRADRALCEAKALVTETLAEINRLENPKGHRRRAPTTYLKATLRPFLEGTIEPCALTLLAGAVPLEPQPPDWPGERPKREAIEASVTADQIKPWQLISYVEQGPHRPPEAQYNLACFYTRAGDFTTASRRLLLAVRETQRQERQRLIDATLRDPVLIPLLKKRPGLKAKLYEMVDSKPPFDDMDQLTQHFDLQDRTISHFQGQGWTIDWSVENKDIDMTASKDSETLLIRLPGPESSGKTVDAMFGLVRLYEQQHPDVKHVKASMVIPAVTTYPADAIAAAQNRGLEVLQDTGHGFQPVDKP